MPPKSSAAMTACASGPGGAVVDRLGAVVLHATEKPDSEFDVNVTTIMQAAARWRRGHATVPRRQRR